MPYQTNWYVEKRVVITRVAAVLDLAAANETLLKIDQSLLGLLPTSEQRDFTRV